MYGFNGQEKTPEVGGDGYTAEFWQYDARIGRRWNVDPVLKVYESPYAAFANNPIWFVDPNGADTTINGENHQYKNGSSLENVTVTGKRKKTISNAIESVQQMYHNAIKSSPTLSETLMAINPKEKSARWTSDQLRRFFIKSLDEFPKAHREFATAYFNKGFNKMNKMVGGVYNHLLLGGDFFEYGLALANGQLAPLPDPTGLSSMIINDVSADIDEDIVTISVRNTMLGIYTPDGLGRALRSVASRGHGVNISGTYVSPGELTDIYINGGLVNTSYLQFPNYGFNDTPPTKGGIRYSIFILYNNKATIPIRIYGIQ